MNKKIVMLVIMSMHISVFNADSSQAGTLEVKSRFSDYLEHLPHKAIVAEIGVQEGTFARFIWQITRPKELYLIDCWEHQDPTVFDDPDANVEQKEQDKLYKKVKNMFSQFPEVSVIKSYSKESADLFPDEYFDWVYIDANHAYDFIKEDLAIWYPKVKKGGYICGHDYIKFERHGFGITQAVHEFLSEHGLILSLLTTTDLYESWAIQKP